MKKEFNGRHFRGVGFEAIAPDQTLGCDLFLYLPLNQRMLRLRESGQTIHEAELKRYLDRGIAILFILDPDKNAGTYNPAHPNPALEGFLEGVSTSAAASPELAKPAAEIQPEPSPTLDVIEQITPAEGGAIEIHATKAPEDAGIIEKIEAAEASSLAEAATSEESDIETSFSSESAADPENIFKKSREKRDKESGKNIAAQSSLEEEEKIDFGEEELEEETEQAFSPEKAEEQIRQTLKADSRPAAFSQKIEKEVEQDEDELTKFSPDQEKFVEKTRRLSKGEEKAEDWARSLEEKSEGKIGLSKEEKAAAKLAHALSKKIGKLRQEYNAATRPKENNAQESEDSISFEAEKEEIKERRIALEKQIKKLENTAALLESMDDPEPNTDTLPEEWRNKSAIELVADLEQQIEEIKDTEILNAEDSRLLSAKMKKIKARDHAIHGEGLEKARKELSEKISRAKAEKRALSQEERSSSKDQLIREVKSATIAKNVTKELAEKRQELKALIKAKPKDKAERKANEAKAATLHREIMDLNDLSFAVEAGEPLTEEQTKRFGPNENQVFEVPDDEFSEEQTERAFKNLEALRDEVVSAKNEAAAAETELMAEVNRGYSSPASEAPPTLSFSSTPDPESQGATVSMASLGSLDNLQQELTQLQSDPKGSPEEIAVQLGKAFREANRVAQVVALEKHATSLRQDLMNLLANPVDSADQKRDIESRALSLLKNIREVESARDGAQLGETPAAQLLAKLGPNNSDLKLGPLETPQEGMKRIVESLGQLKTESINAAEASRNSSLALTEALDASDYKQLKQSSVNANEIAESQKILSRHLQQFLETGKDPDPKEVWQIKQLTAEQVNSANVRLNIGKKLNTSAEELLELRSMPPGEEPSQEQKEKQARLENEIFRLKNLGEALDRGEKVDEKYVIPFTEDLPEVFRFEGGTLPVDQLTRMVEALATIKEELILVKRGSLAAIDQLNLAPNQAPEKQAKSELAHNPEEELQRLVSGEDGKLAQAGVYAATLAKAFGYEISTFEKDVILAAQLWKYPADQVSEAFSPNVALIHRAAQKPSLADEIFVKDLGQAVRLANLYLEVPGVITGKFSLDSAMFDKLCLVIGKNPGLMDWQNLERARQSSGLPLAEAERINLVDRSKEAYAEIGKWKQTEAA